MRKIFKHHLLNVLFFCFASGIGNTAFAQQELTLNFMNRTFQSTATNPAFFPKNNFVFALPPSMVLNFANTGFTWRQLIHKSGDAPDSTEFFFEDVYNNKLGKTNYLFTDMHVDYLNCGFRINRWRMHFLLNVTEKINLRLKYDKEFFGFFTLGNGYFIDEEANLNSALEGTHYREYGLTMGYTQENKYSFGLKVKYLQGLGNIFAEKTDITVKTQTEPYIQVAATTDYKLNVSGFVVYETTDAEGATVDSSADFDAADYLANFGNPGFAFDLGGTYTFKLPVLKNRFTVSASVLDIGFIRWKTNVMNLHSQGNYTTAGLDIVDVITNGDKFSLDNVYDTLNERFKFKKSYDAYKTSLIAKTYVGAKMEIDTNSNVGMMFFGEFFEGLKPGVTVAYDRTFGKKKKHSFVVTWSYKNRSFLNLGFGWQVKFGPVQLFACGDNLSAYIIPRDTKSFNLRFGMNLTIGKTKFPDPKPKASDSEKL